MKITTSIDILSKPENIFPWVAQPDKAMRWQKDVKGGEIIKETPEKIGTTFKILASMVTNMVLFVWKMTSWYNWSP